MQSRKMDMFICKLQMEKNLQVYENAKLTMFITAICVYF